VLGSRLLGRRRRSVGELGDQRCDLVLPEAAQPPVGGDIEPFHNTIGTHGTYSRQGFQHIDDLGMGNDIVGLGKIEHLRKAAFTGAQILFDLGAAASSLGRCMSGLLTLLVAQRGYRHSSRPHLAARQFVGQA
jgi:hypothetical protein